ncbi:hypothetical protein G6F65_023464 [Rhizopus arrhizus]|nr:hypothetical protein G6F65_023464 [Rhizopus arrhizus]
MQPSGQRGTDADASPDDQGRLAWRRTCAPDWLSCPSGAGQAGLRAFAQALEPQVMLLFQPLGETVRGPDPHCADLRCIGIE